MLPLFQAALLTTLLFFANISASQAQTQYYGGPEIRRATPVRPADPNAQATPEPNDSIPTPRAVPFDPGDFPDSDIRTMPPMPIPSPGASPTMPPPPPGSPAVPVSPPVGENPQSPVQTPSQPPAPAPAPTANGQNGGEIRMAPDSPENAARTPDKMLFDTANGLYSRKMYDLAAAEYERYLRDFAGGPDRQAVLFRLAESLRTLKRPQEAESLYEQLLVDYHTGEFIGPASYRLGMIYFDQTNYQGALALFQRAATRVEQQELKLASRYYEARTLEKLDRKAEMLESYRELAAVRANNPYLEAARLALAQYAGDLGRHSESLAAYEALANESDKPEIRIQATVQVALISNDMKLNDKALEWFEKAMALPDLGKWKPIAQAGYFRALSNAAKYEEVIKQFDARKESLDPKVLPEVLLLVGNAQRELGQNEAAAKTYAELRKRFPSSEEARDAGIQELVSAFMSGDENISSKVDAYIRTNPPIELVDQANLIKAEALFKKEDYAGAGAVYAGLLEATLKPRLRAETLYKLGWCYTQINNFERAAQVFTMFVDEFGDAENEPAARLQRGLAYQKLARYDDAILDFSRIVTRSPKAPEREIALQQKALLQGQLNDNSGMVETFRVLLKDYPESAASAQANYWIGWAYFEAKDYKNAIPFLDAARAKDSAQYFDRSTLRMILSSYYQEDTTGLAKEVDAYIEAKASPPVPGEVLRYLGAKLLEEGKLDEAEKFMSAAAGEGTLDNDTLLSLARLQTTQGKFDEAEKSVRQALKSIEEPLPKAQALLVLGRAQLGSNQLQAARQSADEILKLQPEGRLNAEGRMLIGEIEMKSGKFAEAARSLMSVVVLYEDVRLTPRAMDLARQAFEKAGNSAEATRLASEIRARYPDYKP